MRGLSVAIVGATGLVGREIASLLGERSFPVSDLRLFASARSAGEEIEVAGKGILVEELPVKLPRFELAFLCANSEISRRIASMLAAEGAAVIDLTAAHRGDRDVPLMLAGTSEAVPGASERGLLVSTPHPLTVLLAWPLRTLAGLGRIRSVFATAVLSASAFGMGSIERLAVSSAALLGAEDAEEEASSVTAFGCGPFPETGAGLVPAEVERDVSRLLGAQIPIRLALLGIPGFHGHGVSAFVMMGDDVTLEQVRAALREAPSIALDDPDDPPTGTREAVGSDAIHVGDLRDASPGLHFWATADNVRQGAALNAVAVAEALARSRFSH